MSEFLILETADAKALKTLADNILKEFSMEEYGPVSVAIHEQTSSLDDIGTVYRELISALVTRPFSRSHCVLLCPEDKSGENQTIGKSAPVHMETELYHLLETGQRSETEKSSKISEARDRRAVFVAFPASEYLLSTKVIYMPS